MLPLMVLSPFLLIPAAAWLGKLPARWAGLLAIWPTVLFVYFGSLIGAAGGSTPAAAAFPWAGSLGLVLSFYADGLSLLFALLITGIGALIVVFGSSYLSGDPAAGRFQATLFAFMGSMLGVVLADNLLTLFVFWELTGFTSFLLIGFDQDRKEARASAIQALMVTGTGGMALLAAAVLIEKAAGVVTISALISGSTSLREAAAYPAIVILVLLAAFTKSAQAPFHFWLPNAMTAPTPVSAYLHSATMVKAGIYLVARMTPLLGATALWTGLVTAAGAITMALGAWRALAETDLKRVLAYSTISALGVIMMLLGVGTEAAVTAALVYLLAHACYKGTLFLVAGTLEHETGTRDITELGGLRSSMPILALAGGLAALSMTGVPLFLGFIGKELLYDALLGVGASWAHAVLAVAVIASALLGVAGLVAGVAPFSGAIAKAVVSHSVPRALSLPPLLLAIAGLVGGLWPGSLDVIVQTATANVLPTTGPLHLAIWHGFTPVLALSLVTLALVALLYRSREVIRNRIWPRSLGFDRLYTGGVRALDAISAWSLPALQGASLRSYALALVVTAGVMLAVVIVAAGLPPWPEVTSIRFHEGAAALMIIGGALNAARATTTIAAVLSLGVTGYGVALMFIIFGAPDLAMTQFSVETVTAVIFVMVFYHFRTIGVLSPWPVRLRDALIAISFGSSIAIVLFFVGASSTPFRIAGYYADMAVPLTHGRNIVNVILVDFRALDTLGEITVLATAALGVRAVLRLGRGNEKSS